MSVEIDENELNELIEISKLEFPDIDPYIIHVYSVEYLTEKAGYKNDIDLGKELYEKAQEEKKTEKYFFKVETVI